MIRILLLVLSVLLFASLFAQQKDDFTKVFQFSLTPGISTNGMHPAGYSNYFSLNLTSGYSSANYLLEVGLVSNLNIAGTRGLQIAGIANLTGANAFAGLAPKEVDKKKREGFEANVSGVQLSGAANIVLNNVFGWQTAGGVNLAKGALMGFQLAGISNTVYKYSFGVQLAEPIMCLQNPLMVFRLPVYSISQKEVFTDFNSAFLTNPGLQKGKILLKTKTPRVCRLEL